MLKFPDRAPVTEQKKEALRQRVRLLGIDLGLVEVSFAKGSGPGGQKVNKTSNVVVLRYPPLGITVRSGRERSRAINVFLALRLLADEVERVTKGTLGRDQSMRQRIAKQKARRKRRRKARSETEREDVAPDRRTR